MKPILLLMLTLLTINTINTATKMPQPQNPPTYRQALQSMPAYFTRLPNYSEAIIQLLLTQIIVTHTTIANPPQNTHKTTPPPPDYNQTSQLPGYNPNTGYTSNPSSNIPQPTQTPSAPSKLNPTAEPFFPKSTTTTTAWNNRSNQAPYTAVSYIIPQPTSGKN